MGSREQGYETSVSCAVLSRRVESKLYDDLMRIDSQNERHLEQRRTDLKKRGNSPRPVTGNTVGAETNTSRSDHADGVRDVEECSEHRSLLGIAKFANKSCPGNYASWNTEAENAASNNVHDNWTILASVSYSSKDFRGLPCLDSP